MSRITYKPCFVRGIHQGSQFVIGVLRIARKARIGAEEIVNAVAVIGAFLKSHVFEHRAEPDSARAESLNVRQLILNSGKVAALKPKEIWIVEWLVTGAPRRSC